MHITLNKYPSVEVKNEPLMPPILSHLKCIICLNPAPEKGNKTLTMQEIPVTDTIIHVPIIPHDF